MSSGLLVAAWSLVGVGKSLATFTVPDNVHWKPLGPQMRRVRVGDEFYIHNHATGETFKQIPSNYLLSSVPLLCSIADQGGINRPPLDYISFALGQSVLILYDQAHRCWNDVRTALKSAKLWRSFLTTALIYNVNYAFAGTKAWLARKQACVKDMVDLMSDKAHAEPFLSYIPLICSEKQIREPTTAEERETLYFQLTDMKSVQTARPLVKLMRWFSWFASEGYRGEMWQTKLLMLDHCMPEETIDPLQVDLENGKKITEKEELKQLKAKHGTWVLAPKLLTPTFILD